jgi:1,4-alpha-glucan branching enzyme
MTETFAHAMPFGAQLLPDGHARFQLWAPSQETVALVLEDRQRILPMTRLESGFFAVTTDAARAGSRYRFQLEDGFRVPDPASRCQPKECTTEVVVDPGVRLRVPRARPALAERCTSCTSVRSAEGTFEGCSASRSPGRT